jgi:MinD-like ATPase involved in chromosome partitioning or flagellar assembly
MLKTLLKRGTDEVAEATALGVVIAAPPELFQPFLALGGGDQHVHILATTRDAADLAGDVQAYRPQVVLLSPEVRGYSPELVAQLVNWPEFPIAVIGLVPPNGNWGAEMSAQGATAFYTTPVTPAIVSQFDRQARLLFEQARQTWNAPVAAAGIPRQVAEAVGATGYAYRTGVIAFWSTKGGDGKTTLAVNVACLLSQVAGKKVLLVDGDMNCGRAALHLNMQPDQNTLLHLASDYAGADGQLTGKMLRRRVVGADRHLDARTRVVESRLDVLFGITKIQQASAPELHGRQGQQFMGDLLRLARELYDFVIVDLGSSTQMGPHFGALTAADIVVLICTSDRTSLFHNRATLQSLTAEADLRADKFKLVINRYDQADRIDLKDAASFMGMPIFATVPEDRSRAVIAAVNEGRPFVLQHMGKNTPETEATLKGFLAITEEIFPPIGAIIKARASQNGRRPRFSFGRGGSQR